MLRKDPLTTGNYYHIFNRGVNKNDIFFSDKDYERFIATAIHYKKYTYKFPSVSSYDPVSSKLEVMPLPKVKIVAYCLMPNHFHFLIYQLEEGGITWFMQHLINSYVHYVNIKHDRVGPLFQGRFKNVLVDSDNQLLHLSRYIHLNPIVSDLTNNIENYAWSSYSSYIHGFNDYLSEPQDLISNFKSNKEYRDFVLDQEDYARSLELLKHHILD